jgi:microsomal dipeptidase-like Zn-dependent dipeptidase
MLPGSANRRRVVVDAIVGNLCKVIHSCQNIKAWDMITITSHFDTHARHFEEFSSSSDMVVLHRALVDFFENPRDIEGLYTAKEIKKFMYNYSAKEIVDKVMFKNALRFLKKHLPEAEAN